MYAVLSTWTEVIIWQSRHSSETETETRVESSSSSVRMCRQSFARQRHSVCLFLSLDPRQSGKRSSLIESIELRITNILKSRNAALVSLGIIVQYFRITRVRLRVMLMLMLTLMLMLGEIFPTVRTASHSAFGIRSLTVVTSREHPQNFSSQTFALYTVQSSRACEIEPHFSYECGSKQKLMSFESCTRDLIVSVLCTLLMMSNKKGDLYSEQSIHLRCV